MGAKSDTEPGIKCGGTVSVSSLVSGPDISLDVRVRGIKYEGDRGCKCVGADLDSLSMKK